MVWCDPLIDCFPIVARPEIFYSSYATYQFPAANHIYHFFKEGHVVHFVRL